MLMIMPDRENHSNVLQQSAVDATTDNWFTLDESSDIRCNRKPRGSRKKQRDGRHLQRARAYQHTLKKSFTELAGKPSSDVEMTMPPDIAIERETSKKRHRPGPMERTCKLLSDIYEHSGLGPTAVLVSLNAEFKPVTSPLPALSADSLKAITTATEGSTSTFAEAEGHTTGILRQLEYYSTHLGRTQVYHEKIMAGRPVVSPVLINQVTYGRMVLSIVVRTLVRRHQEARVQLLILDQEHKLSYKQISEILGPFWSGNNLDPEPIHSWPWLTDDVVRRYWHLMRCMQ